MKAWLFKLNSHSFILHPSSFRLALRFAFSFRLGYTLLARPARTKPFGAARGRCCWNELDTQSTGELGFPVRLETGETRNFRLVA